MKFNIFFTITGPSGRVVESPNSSDPVEAESMDDILLKLTGNLPQIGGIIVLGLRIEQVPE